jgi:predicted PurR-regulated permease PerM
MNPGSTASLMRTLSPLVKLATGALVIVALSKAQMVLIPIAFALVLSFILSTPLKWLQRWMPSWAGLTLVMLVTVGSIGGLTFLLTNQLNDLTTQLTQYTESMRKKVTSAQQGGGGAVDRMQVMFKRITERVATEEDGRNIAVHFEPAKLSAVEHLLGLVQPLAEPVMMSLFVLVLCAFLLARRDDVRNRLIRLVGPANVTSTTHALDEGGQRISRYLLGEVMISAGFALAAGLGLFLIGIPHAALWGGLAGAARFVPYLGVFVSTLVPAMLAFALFPGWRATLMTVGLLGGLTLVANFAVEPLVIGRRTGVSSIALLVSALFWGWLWGPVGLVLATPLTLSLGVLGRHVRELRFLAVIVGDEQALETEVSHSSTDPKPRGLSTV